MNGPKFSVIVPVYNGSAFLGQAIESVITQTYEHFELILVDDASPQSPEPIVDRYGDPRVRFIRHSNNRGSDVARHTGFLASSGDLVAFLDQDDMYHPDKLKAHAELHARHPDTGLSYNARFELNHSAETIRDIWRPPPSISLADLVNWFPIAPSETVIARRWVSDLDLISGSRGAELRQYSGLFMSGCRFRYVDRPLNYRRHHRGRIVRNLLASCESEVANQTAVFADSRCPPELGALRGQAHANLYTYWAYLALAQGDVSVGHELLRRALDSKPSLVGGEPSELTLAFLVNAIDDENQDHAQHLERLFRQLPPDLTHLAQQCAWTVSEGFLLKGARAAMWGRQQDASRHFAQALKRGASVDDYFVRWTSSKLLDFEAVYGLEAAEEAASSVSAGIQEVAGRRAVRRLMGQYLFSRAFQRWASGRRDEVRTTMLRAVVNQPRYLTNRGAMSLIMRSVAGGWTRKSAGWRKSEADSPSHPAFRK